MGRRHRSERGRGDDGRVLAERTGARPRDDHATRRPRAADGGSGRPARGHAPRRRTGWSGCSSSLRRGQRAQRRDAHVRGRDQRRPVRAAVRPVYAESGGFPGTRPRPAPVVVRSSSECQTGSRPDRITVRQHVSTSVRPRVRYTAPSQRTIRQRTGARSASSARLAVTVPRVSSAAVTGEAATLWKRPEGPGAEDDLIILGLL
jgi:hypothetical protein